MWVKQYPEVNDLDKYAKELIATEYACFKTNCGKYFYGYLRDDNDDFSDSFGETFISWKGNEDVDYRKEWWKLENPINVLGNNISSIEESDNLDSWFILAIVGDSVKKNQNSKLKKEIHTKQQ